jgi:TRAP-type transport system periplasmic protein
MEQRFHSLVILMIVTGVILFFNVSMVSGKTTTLTYSNFFPPNHIQSKLAQSWCDEVEKRTNGRVVVQYFPGQTLTKSKQNYDGVVTGLSDIGLCLFAYSKGRFPVMEAVDLPIGYTSGTVATKVVNEVYNEFKPKELSDTQVMYLHAHGPGILFTKGKAIRRMEDFKGIKIRAHGTSGLVISALGGTPVTMPMPDLYPSLQRGVVEGGLYPMETNKGWKMGEVIDHITNSTSIAYTSSFYVVMNKNKWNALPADIQKIIMKINQEWIPKHGEAWDSSDREGLAFCKSLGHKFIELQPKESARWKKAVEPIIADYIKKMNKDGLNGDKLVNFVIKTLNKYQ